MAVTRNMNKSEDNSNFMREYSQANELRKLGGARAALSPNPVPKLKENNFEAFYLLNRTKKHLRPSILDLPMFSGEKDA